MNKTILSLAVLTASGGYVAFANHVFDGVPALGTALSAQVVAKLDGEVEAAPIAASTPVAHDVPDTMPGRIVLPQVLGEHEDDEDEDDVPSALPLPAVRSAPEGAPQVAAVAPIPAPPPTSRLGVVVSSPPPAAPAPSSHVAEAVVPASTAKFRDGTYKGSIENAYYGEVQVEATIKGGELVAVNVLDYPQDRRTSRRINNYALPILEEEVIAAQTARVNLVTGATLTSRAYRASLDTALQQAEAGHA